MIILGIDPGYERMGLGVIEKTPKGEHPVYSCCVTTERSLSHQQRLLDIFNGVKKIIEKYKPDVAAVEKLFFAGNQKTAVKVAEARGVILCALAESGIKTNEFTPLEVKMALTGYGRAEKEQVKKMVLALLKTDKTPKMDDEMDALAIALTCSSAVKFSHLG